MATGKRRRPWWLLPVMLGVLIGILLPMLIDRRDVGYIISDIAAMMRNAPAQK